MGLKFLQDIANLDNIQFINSSGTNAGLINMDGNDLVISNSQGDVLLGDGSADVFIGDGTNNVDIRFEQSGSITADNASATLTIGGTGNLVVEEPTINNPTFSGAFNLGSKLTLSTSNGYILFDYEPAGDTGEYTTEVPLLKVDHNGVEKTILSRISENGGIQLGHDDSVLITAGDVGDEIKSNWGATNENVVIASEAGFTSYAFPNNSTTWSNRNEFRFYGGDATAANNGLYIGDGSNTQFIDLDRNISAASVTAGNIKAMGGGNLFVYDDDDDTKIHFFASSNSNEGFLQLSNGSNWGLLARGKGNDPRLGAYHGGYLSIWGFGSNTGDDHVDDDELARFDFANERLIVNGEISTGGNITTSSNSYIVSSRKFTARDANGTGLFADDAASGLSIADDGDATFTGDLTVNGVNYGAYHSVNEDQYYFDDYNGRRNLAFFYKNARADIIRYQPVDNFEYWNGSAWVADSSQESNVKKLLDGRQDTSWNVPSTYYKFRFTTQTTTSWPTMAMIWMQTSWSGSTYPGATMTVEEYDGSSWATKVTAEFTSGNGSTHWGLHSRADTALHTGNGSSADTTRITIDFYGWTPSNGSYTTIPLQNLMITSNYAGTENTDYTNLLSHDKHLRLGDNRMLVFGDGDDLQIYHDGSNSVIDDAGTGNLKIRSNRLQLEKYTGETMAEFIADGSSSLYYDNNKKLETTSTGVEVTGNIAVSGTVDGRDIATDGTKLDTIATNADVTPSWVPSSDPSYLTEHPNISAASSVNNSGKTHIQDITVDSNGHVTGIVSHTLNSSDFVEPNSNATLNSLSCGTFTHPTDISFVLDNDNNETASFTIKDGAGNSPFTLTEAGDLTITGKFVSTYAAKGSSGDILVEDSGEIKKRTPAELKTDLSLNNVPNTDATNASNLASGTVPTARLATTTIAKGGTGATTASGARTALGVDAAGTDNSTDVTLAGSLNYITISGQEITRNAIDLAADVTGTLPQTNLPDDMDSDKVKQICTTHHNFFMNSSSTTADFFVPFNNLNESSNPTNAQYYNRTVAPYGGRLVKIALHTTAAIGSACKVQFWKANSNGTFASYTEEVTGIDLNTANSSDTAAFSSATFSEGDVVGVSIIKSSSATANMQVTLVWEYTL